MSAIDVDEALFPGVLAPFRNSLAWEIDSCSPPEQAPSRPDLLDALARFQRSVDGPWRPACSLWAQLYFNTLLIPATCLLTHASERAPQVSAVTVSLCPTTGAPHRCVLRTVETDRHAADFGRELADAVGRHVDQIVVELAQAGRLARGLLRESAGRAVAWTLWEISLADPARAAATRALLSAWDSSAIATADRHGPETTRRYCCLRDQLSNIPSCGNACPRGRTRSSPPGLDDNPR